ncbi:MAG: metal-dependent hydrolase [bacterium]|nr:metal-dependent hydrolase [bacterium]
MDVLAHTLWTNAVFHYKYHHSRKMRYTAAFFGVAPDLIGFAPLFIYLIVSGRMFQERFPFGDQSNWTFAFAEQAYNYTHSLVIFAAIFIAVLLIGNVYFYIRNKKNARHPERQRRISFWFFWPMLGWLIHILIDIPTHPDFYQTPMFFPLSDFRSSHGVSWGHPVFMAVNYGLLVMIYVALFYYKKRKNASKS